MVNIKRIYEPYDKNDGFRVLVDRLWPRGVSKEKAKIGLWLKDIAPSTGLREWFSHDPKKWATFKRKYKQELKINFYLLGELKKLEKEHKNLTLLYAAKDEQHNEAIVLLEALKNKVALKSK